MPRSVSATIYIEIQPNALAIELIKMIAAKNGHRKRIMALKTFLLRKGAPFRVTSSAMRSTPMTRETRMQLAMAAMGIITELVRKSKKSKNCMPITVTFASGP